MRTFTEYAAEVQTSPAEVAHFLHQFRLAPSRADLNLEGTAISTQQMMGSEYPHSPYVNEPLDPDQPVELFPQQFNLMFSLTGKRYLDYIYHPPFERLELLTGRLTLLDSVHVEGARAFNKKFSTAPAVRHSVSLRLVNEAGDPTASLKGRVVLMETKQK